jgi:hypothetical protein
VVRRQHPTGRRLAQLSQRRWNVADPGSTRGGKEQRESAKEPPPQAQPEHPSRPENPSRKEADRAQTDDAAREAVEAERFQATDN